MLLNIITGLLLANLSSTGLADVQVVAAEQVRTEHLKSGTPCIVRGTSRTYAGTAADILSASPKAAEKQEVLNAVHVLEGLSAGPKKIAASTLADLRERGWLAKISRGPDLFRRCALRVRLSTPIQASNYAALLVTIDQGGSKPRVHGGMILKREVDGWRLLLSQPGYIVVI